MTVWTTPRTWTSEVLTSTLLNIHLRDNLNHLYENSIPIFLSGLKGSADRDGANGAGSSEEWNTATTGLTWDNSPSTVDSNTTIPGHLYISNQADTTARLGTKSWAPTGAAAFDARLGRVLVASSSSIAAQDGSFGLHIGNSDNSLRLALLAIYTYDTRVTNLKAYTYASSTYTQRGSSIAVASHVPIYLRIVRDASNNCSFLYSLNGVLWQFIATQAHTLTVANIGVRAVGNATAAFQAAADWMRTDV